MEAMKIGTKSVLFGYHCFFIHPWFVAWAWWKLYGFPWDPRLWVAFFIHDIGYLGKPNMDGPEGEDHPWLGAMIMDVFFGKEWFYFVYFHSRYLAKKNGVKYSILCVADKLALTLYPNWLALLLYRLSEEGELYFNESRKTHPDMPHDYKDIPSWHQTVKKYCSEWVEAHKDNQEDSWTIPRK